MLLMLDAIGFALSPSKAYTRLMIHDMYTEKSIDVVFIGPSRTYRGINPRIVDSTVGIDSFNMGSADQGMDDTYYLLKEMYKYHTPKIVFINVGQNGFFTDSSNRQTEILFDYLRISPNKFSYLLNAFKPEDYLRGIFQVIRYRDLNEVLSPRTVSNNLITKLSSEYLSYSPSLLRYETEWYVGRGFVYSTRSLPKRISINVYSSGRVWDVARVDEENVAFLEKSIRLCKEHCSTPVLLDLPTSITHVSRWENYAVYDNFVQELASKNGVEYFDLTRIKNSVFERKNEYYRDYQHLNGKGAIEFSNVFANFLIEYMDGTLNIDDYLYSSFEEMMDDFKRCYELWDEKASDIIPPDILDSSERID